MCPADASFHILPIRKEHSWKYFSFSEMSLSRAFLTLFLPLRWSLFTPGGGGGTQSTNEQAPRRLLTQQQQLFCNPPIWAQNFWSGKKWTTEKQAMLVKSTLGSKQGLEAKKKFQLDCLV